MNRRIARRQRPEIDGSALRWPGAAQKFALFGEVLWVGALMTLVCIPIITWPAAVAAGSAHLRRFVHAEATPASAFFRDALRALPGALGLGALTAALAVIIGVDLALVAGGVMPGGTPVGLIAASVGVAAMTLAVLAASLWSPGVRWREIVRVAPRVAAADLSGTVYILTALGLGGIVTWQFLPLGIPALGLVAFALVTLGERRMVRWAEAAA